MPEASSVLGNKFLRPRPCCSGAHSGAGARSVRVEPPVPGVELLCWRQRPAFYRPGREVSTLAFWFEDTAAAMSLAAGRRVDRARVPPTMVDGELWSKIVAAWVRPRSTGYRRCLYLICLGECLLRLFSKPCGDGASADLRKTASRRGARQVAGAIGL